MDAQEIQVHDGERHERVTRTLAKRGVPLLDEILYGGRDAGGFDRAEAHAATPIGVGFDDIHGVLTIAPSIGLFSPGDRMEAANRIHRDGQLSRSPLVSTPGLDECCRRGTLRAMAFDIHGPAGRLEALVDDPALDCHIGPVRTEAAGEVRLDADRDEQPRVAVVLAHPLPTGGGTMHSKVVYQIAKGFCRIGAPVLRFNFRGVGTSDGAFEDGPGEMADYRAALDFMAARYPGAEYGPPGSPSAHGWR